MDRDASFGHPERVPAGVQVVEVELVERVVGHGERKGLGTPVERVARWRTALRHELEADLGVDQVALVRAVPGRVQQVDGRQREREIRRIRGEHRDGALGKREVHDDVVARRVGVVEAGVVPEHDLSGERIADQER